MVSKQINQKQRLEKQHNWSLKHKHMTKLLFGLFAIAASLAVGPFLTSRSAAAFSFGDSQMALSVGASPSYVCSDSKQTKYVFSTPVNNDLNLCAKWTQITPPPTGISNSAADFVKASGLYWTIGSVVAILMLCCRYAYRRMKDVR